MFQTFISQNFLPNNIDNARYNHLHKSHLSPGLLQGLMMSDQDNTEDKSPSLDQSEIDNILGNVFEKSHTREESGIERIIKAGFVSYERMPMLENAFDRLIRLLSATLRAFTNDSVDITLESIKSLRFGDYMESVPSSSSFGVFKAEQWKNLGLIIVDSALSYSIIDLLMGGQRGSGTKIIENRAHTPIERSLIEKLITITLADLSTAFEPVCKIDFTFDRLEMSSSFAVIARPSNATVAARFHIDMEDRSGNMDIVIPYATLEPVREKLTQQFMGENYGSDSIWGEHLLGEIIETNVTVSAILNEKEFPLRDILSLEKGSTLIFPHQEGTPYKVRLQCDDTPMFEGTLGKINDRLSVKIGARLIPADDEIVKKEDLESIGINALTSPSS